LIIIQINKFIIIDDFRFFKYSKLPTNPYFSINDESLMKPVVDQIVSAELATILNTIVPVVMLILLELIFFFDIID